VAKLRSRDGLAELRTAVWILHGSIDPLQTLAATRTVPGAERFSLRIAAGRAPIEGIFVFRPGTIIEETLSFTWQHESAAILPSMSGTLIARRFGPLVVLLIHAKYARGLDVAERLFHEAVGRRLAKRTFAALRHALVHLLQHLPSHSIYEAMT
jgi:hypothetical protein